MASSTRSAAAIPPMLKDLNERAILEAIRADAPISRAEISRRVGISKPTVSVALQSLLEAGLVREATEPLAGPRYGAVFFEPVPDVAVGARPRSRGAVPSRAICDLRGEVRARQDVEIAGADAERALDAGSGAARRARDRRDRPRRRIDGAVIGVPGVVVGEAGEVRLAKALHGLEEMEVAAGLGRRLGVPITVENDVDLAAVGEQFRGVARGVEDFAFLSWAPASAPGCVSRRAAPRPPSRRAWSASPPRGSDRDIDPCARRCRPWPSAWPARRRSRVRRPRSRRPSRSPRSSPPRGPATRSRRSSSRRPADRPAHASIAAVADPSAGRPGRGPWRQRRPAADRSASCSPSGCPTRGT